MWNLMGRWFFTVPCPPDMNRKLFDYFKPKNMAIFVETNYELLVNDIGLEYVNEHIKWCKAHNEPYDKQLFDLAEPLDSIEHPEQLGINKMLFVTNTIGIGDGENDMEMLKACGVGIAMGNANPVLKEIADYVTTDVDKDGLKKAFEHYGLI